MAATIEHALSGVELSASAPPLQPRPTNPSQVVEGTALASLDLSWREADLPQKDRTKHVHGLHPYLGKFVPQLVEVFLRKYFRPGQVVFDPFVGSGTTLVQANELGINAVGCDVSAFNVLLCRVKLTEYKLAQVREEALDALDKTRQLSQRRQLWLWPAVTGNASVGGPRDSYLEQWFAPQALTELLTYRGLLDSEGYEYADLLKVVLSRSARSARLTTHFDLDFPKQPQREPYWCYKHSRMCEPTEEALKFLERYTVDALRRIEEFASRRSDAWCTIHHDDSRRMTCPAVHGVITSPPYVGLIDYHEQHAYAYHLLGLQDKRADEIGRAGNGSGQKARLAYQADIAGVLGRAMSAIPAGARLIVVAGDRYDLYSGIARLIGAEVEATLQRHVNRRTGRRSSEFFETVFVWRKP